MICDFCSDENPTHEIPCRDFTVLDWMSTGAWMACDRCFEVVELEDIEHLTRYALMRYREKHEGQLTPEVSIFLRECYRLFWDSRI